MTAEMRSLLERRLIIVTGKGGVGKTTVCCALAEAARRAGKRVLLAETSPIESVAARFEPNPKPLDYRGRALRPKLQAMHIAPYDALAHYIHLQTGLGAVTDRLLRTRAFQQFFEAAPGWRELIILGAIWFQEAQRDDRELPVHDLLIVDAPATGHGMTFLDVPRVVQQAVQAGPMSHYAGLVEALIHDRERTLLLPVTLAEELPVSETIELVERAREHIDIAVDRIVVNRLPLHLTPGLVSSLERVHADGTDALAFEALPPMPPLGEIVRHVARRDALASAQRVRVSEACGLPILDLPNRLAGFAAGSRWEAEVDGLLETPIWPTATRQDESAA